jgi:hypothetical protein
MGSSAKETTGNRRWQQVLYILAPFFLLLVCLGFINFVPGLLTAVPTTPPQPEDGITPEVTAVLAVPAPTVTIPPTPTLIPTATLPPDAAIELLGPPDGSSFRRLDTVSFYADWPVALVESQQLAVYVRFDDQTPILLGTLDEPNIGQRYRWQLNVGEMANTPALRAEGEVEAAVSLSWWVQLQTSNDSSPRLTSSIRQVTLLP